MKDSTRWITVSLLIILSAVTVYADDPLEGVSIFGFADFYSEMNNDDPLDKNFNFGQVEIDLEAPLADGISFEAGIAFDPAAQTFGVGAFIIDFDVFESDETHLEEGAGGINHTGIVVGQFDVPWGLDWRVYPSIDRQLVSAPLVVESTHGLWNDFGIQAYTDRDWFNVVGFLLNGFGYSAAFGPQGGFLGYNGLGYDPADSTITEIEAATHFAAGGRLGLYPMTGVELGGSWAAFFDKGHGANMSLIGGDITAKLAALELKGEYIVHIINPVTGVERENNGYYIQGLYRFAKPWYLFTRYGSFTPDIAGASTASRISLGGGYSIAEGVHFRLEQQLNDDGVDTSSITYLQVAIGF